MAHHTFPFCRAAIVSFTLALLAASTAAAQTPPASPAAAPRTGLVWSADLAQRVTGRHLIITTSDGRVYEGVVNVSPTAIETTSKDARAAVPFGQIVRIEKPTYRIRTGVFLGVAAGVLTGIVWGCTVDTHCGTEAFLGAIAFGSLGAGVGAGIGAVINRASQYDDILYDSNRLSMTMAVAPILSPTRRGVAVRMTWR